jgi:hypothetical protein
MDTLLVAPFAILLTRHQVIEHRHVHFVSLVRINAGSTLIREGPCSRWIRVLYFSRWNVCACQSSLPSELENAAACLVVGGADFGSFLISKETSKVTYGSLKHE